MGQFRLRLFGLGFFPTGVLLRVRMLWRLLRWLGGRVGRLLLRGGVTVVAIERHRGTGRPFRGRIALEPRSFGWRYELDLHRIGRRHCLGRAPGERHQAERKGADMGDDRDNYPGSNESLQSDHRRSCQHRSAPPASYRPPRFFVVFIRRRPPEDNPGVAGSFYNKVSRFTVIGGDALSFEPFE